MSEMHYIAQFARAQLQKAKDEGMGSEQLAALLNALRDEAEALTPGGGYIVCYVAKEMPLVEQQPPDQAGQEKPAESGLMNAYLFTCVTGYSNYHQNVVFADTLSGTLLSEIESTLRSRHERPGNSFQLASITPLGLLYRKGFSSLRNKHSD